MVIYTGESSYTFLTFKFLKYFNVQNLTWNRLGFDNDVMGLCKIWLHNTHSILAFYFLHLILSGDNCYRFYAPFYKWGKWSSWSFYSLCSKWQASNMTRGCGIFLLLGSQWYFWGNERTWRMVLSSFWGWLYEAWLCG